MRYNYIVFNTFGSNKKKGDSVASQMINLGNTGESTWDSSIMQIANLTKTKQKIRRPLSLSLSILI
jgi:hypothetical protein